MFADAYIGYERTDEEMKDRVCMSGNRTPG